MNLRDLTIGGTAGTALTAAAFSLPSLWPKPPPTPTVTIRAAVQFVTEDSTKGVGAVYVQGYGRFDKTTGAELSADPLPFEPWTGMVSSGYTLKATVPLPKPTEYGAEVLKIEPLEGVTAGGEYVIRNGEWVQVK